MNEIKIEQIKSTETLNACAQLLVEAYNAEPWNDSWTQEIALRKLTLFFNTPDFIGWTAVKNGQVLGCCIGNIEPYYTGDYYYLKEMFVSPAAQRLGVGAALLNSLKIHLHKINVKMAILFTGMDKFPFDFYTKNKFTEMEGMRMMMLDLNEENT